MLSVCSNIFAYYIDDRLVLRHRRPVSYPYPNAYSHPLPKFRFDSQTREIAIEFDHNPAYLLSSTDTDKDGSGSWRNEAHYLVSQPLRKTRTIIDDASEIITTAISSPISFFSDTFSRKSISNPKEIFDGNIDLKEEEIVDEDRGQEDEVDDSPEIGRHVRMVSVIEDNEGELSNRAQRRRQWVVTPLRRLNARTCGT